MQISGGEWIALAAVVVTIANSFYREWKARNAVIAGDAATAATLKSVIETIQVELKHFTEQMHVFGEQLNLLEQKRQDHDLFCARVQERNLANQQRVTEILSDMRKDVDQLKGQVRNIGSMSADKVIEYPLKGT